MKGLYSKTSYYQIRLLENLFLSVLPCALCGYAGQGHLLLFLLGCVIAFLFYARVSLSRTALPSPFRKQPFEFTIGIRKTWLLLLLIYGLGAIALGVGNVNLLLFCLFCICLCSMFYYQEPEPLVLHWQQSRRPQAFLWLKIRRGLLHLSLLLFPLFLLLLLFYSAEWYKGLIVCLLGAFLVFFMICMKYAVFPRRINASESSMLALCLLCYPLILAIIPYYYIKALQNLKQYA